MSGTALAAYAARFEQFAAGLPEPERRRRRAHLDGFLAAGFPSVRQEQWRYTDLSALAAADFGPASAGSAAQPPLLGGADHLVYANGVLDAAGSSAAAWHGLAVPAAETDGLAELNAAFDRGGLQLRLAAGERLPRPLQVLLAASGSEPGMVHQRHRIELGDHAEATVVFHFLRDGGSHLATHRIDIRLARGASLKLYRIQDGGEGTLLTRIEVEQHRDSTLHAVVVDCGGGLVRHDFNVVLAGAGAATHLSGLYRPQTRAHLDNHTCIAHAAPHCTSRELFRGILGERTRAVFNGKIVVQPGAQKTDSEQRVANLLLSPRAEVDAKPELEIYADDVKCAHGATVGQLDEVALGYLRSRGIPPEQARALLLRAFAVEVLRAIALPQLRAALEARLGFAAEGAEQMDQAEARQEEIGA